MLFLSMLKVLDNNWPAAITMNMGVEDAVLSLLKLVDNNGPAAITMNVDVEDAVLSC